MNENDSAADLIKSISGSISAFFRHLLPGVVIIGTAAVAHPLWFANVNTSSWQHILIAAVIAVAAGNVWFAINRYVIHQFMDYLLYMCGSPGPARTTGWFRYIDDVGKYAAESLCMSEMPPHARQHVAFRGSSILLLYTVAEVGLIGAAWHQDCTLFAQYSVAIYVCSSFLFVVTAIWQNCISRRVDYYVIDNARSIRDRKAHTK